MEEQNNNEELQLETQTLIEEAEWCFQFDDESPQIIAVTPADKVGEQLSVTINLANTTDSAVTFSSANGRLFRLFARPITEEGISLREEQLTQNNTDAETEN
jgi:hypothetical protein